MRCYARAWRARKGVKPRPPRPDRCSVDGCSRGGKFVRGLCPLHYSRWTKHGDPLALNATERGTVRVETVEFNGIIFRRYPDSKNAAHRRYYKPGGRWIKQGVQALHQEVWKAAHGPIPDGAHIHHRNGDLSDNSLANLVCLAPGEHAVEHAPARSAYGKSAKQLAHLDRIRPLAAAWHRSPEGREWHRQHAREAGFIGNRKGSGAGVQPHHD